MRVVLPIYLLASLHLQARAIVHVAAIVEGRGVSGERGVGVGSKLIAIGGVAARLDAAAAGGG
jgi:hypothetical protein